MEEDASWASDERDSEKRRIGRKWQSILERRPRWKRAYEYTFSLSEYDDPRIFAMVQDPAALEERLRAHLPGRLKKMQFRVDLAHLDPRPINPMRMGEVQVYVYNESSGEIETEILRELFRFIPIRVIQCRIYALTHDYDREIAEAFHRIFQTAAPSALTTNI